MNLRMLQQSIDLLQKYTVSAHVCQSKTLRADPTEACPEFMFNTLYYFVIPLKISNAPSLLGWKGVFHSFVL